MTTRRIVVLLDEQTPGHWLHALRRNLQGTLPAPFEVDACIVARPAAASSSRESLLAGVLADTLLGADRLYRKLSSRMSRASAPITVSASRGQAAEQHVRTVRENVVAPRRIEWREIASRDGDIVISTLPGTRELLGTPGNERGTLLWAECDGQVLGSSPRGFLATLAAGSPVVDVRVYAARAGEGGRLFMHSRCAVRSVSPSLNDELLAARVTDILAVCAEQIVSGEDAPPCGTTTEPMSTLAAVAPVAVQTVLRVAARRVAAVSGKGAGRLQWGLGYRRTAGESVEESIRQLPHSELLVPPRGTSWADPFPVRVDGRDLLFFEQEVAAEGRGHIAVAELLPDGRLGRVERVLESPSHLSYPCVFRSDGEWFMVPESRAAERVSLFRATDFPFRWERERDLITGRRLADSTVFERNGRWWLLACRIGVGESTFEDLVGYSAASLSSPWGPIRRLPLTSDATAGRPAGHLLDTPTGLLRPAQDGSRRYGYGLALREVTELGEHTFAEREYLRVTPSWSSELRGVHTFNRSDTLTVIDLLRARG